MIRTCKNCASRIVFDVEKNGLYCERCGSLFDVSDYGDADYIENDVVSDFKDMMDCNIYMCNSCGAEISINDTEASTFCIYCGNPAIVFSRVAKLKKPDAILPFKITKEDAMSIVKNRIQDGVFIPKEIKNLKIEQLRGIYIPYYITKVEADVASIISSEVHSNKSTNTIYSLRAVAASLPWVTTDASLKLNDSLSQRLEPFYLEEAVDFDEDYLVGFYSDMSDVQKSRAVEQAKDRVRHAIEEDMMHDVKGSNKKMQKNRICIDVFDEPITAMLPAWFLTFRYKDKPYTLLINGQTGKLVGGVPWNKALFITLVTVLSILFSTAAVLLFYNVLPIIFSGSSRGNSNGRLLSLIGAGILACFSAAVKNITSSIKSIKRASDSNLTSFVSKRQKGE